MSSIHRFEDAEWHVPTAPGTDPEAAAAAGRAGAARRFLAQGEGGFFSQYSEFPPGYAVPLHSHDHDELILLLGGSCTMSDGQVLHRHDSMVLRAQSEYGFTAGDDGMVFVTIRGGRSGTTLA